MKIMRKIIDINEELCTGCGQCVPSCAEGALTIVDGKARMIGEKYCDGLGACLGECPTGALKVIEREAEDFDEEAVEELMLRKEEEAGAGQKLACGCPSMHIQSFQPAPSSCEAANRPVTTGAPGSALTHWPVQIRLVPPTAPFLKGADLLVAADCTPVAFPRFHQELLPGRVVMVGCPKFDDAEAYVQKFAEIFTIAGLKSITLARMEVPCCGALRAIVDKALARANRTIPLEEIVISPRGEIVRQGKVAA
ncbi:MAG: 4Fe-4S dicluster domain-containing protein [Desulfobacteraceae bacterium]|nr:4Fe-4S dicluster domain-containing protein [Desulfobacteraceae bacterium]